MVPTLSVKDGCAPEGSCEARTVIVEGKAVVSGVQPAARFQARAVTAQEGLTRERRKIWTHAFVAAGASQCGNAVLDPSDRRGTALSGRRRPGHPGAAFRRSNGSLPPSFAEGAA